MATKSQYGTQTKAKRVAAFRNATLAAKFAKPKSVKGQKGSLSREQVREFYNR